MEETIGDDAASGSFQRDVAKEIVAEAPSTAWQHPRPGDVVTVAIEVDGDWRARTWVLGSPPAPPVAGLDIDRCVRTMRLGECAIVRARTADAARPVRLQLLALEHVEDMLGDGKLVRVTAKQGSGWATPQPGSEVQVRFSWRTAPAAGAASATGAAGETALVLHRLAGDLATLMASPEAGDFLRTATQCLGGAVEARREGRDGPEPPAGSMQGPVVRVARGEQVLAEAPRGMGFAEARAILEAVPPEQAAHQAAREVAVRMGDDGCSCSAEDWLPESVGPRILSDVRSGQRCLVRLAPELAQARPGLPQLPADGGLVLEYDVEVLRVVTLEDVSLGRDGSVTKKVTAEGTGYERPTDGAEVVLRIEARDDVSSAVLADEQEHRFPAASGRFCSAIDETVLTMKRGEACEVRCTDLAASTDAALGLRPAEGAVVVFRLELSSFEALDLGLGQEEKDKVTHCAARKEVGSRFFQEGSVRRALRRYDHVTSTLSYLDHWTDQGAKAEALALRRVCHLNAAACHLKLGAWRQAEEASRCVLQEEPQNVKALFRRGQALKELREYREAEQCLRRLLELDPENRAAASTLARLRHLTKAEAEQQRELLSRMARGLQKNAEAQAVGEEPAEVPRKVVEPAATAEEPLGSATWLWVAVGLLACSALGVVLLRRHRQ